MQNQHHGKVESKNIVLCASTYALLYGFFDADQAGTLAMALGLKLG